MKTFHVVTMTLLCAIAGCGNTNMCGTGESCASADGARPDGGVPPGAKRVFVTSAAYAGNSIASCTIVARSVSLSGTWTPWLSGSGAMVHDAIAFISGDGPWYLLDGRVAFATGAQLATEPSVPIEITETGETVSDGPVWTGTLTGGFHSGADCDSWTASTSTGD